jgi:hypothetical protein
LFSSCSGIKSFSEKVENNRNRRHFVLPVTLPEPESESLFFVMKICPEPEPCDFPNLLFEINLSQVYEFLITLLLMFKIINLKDLQIL